MCKPCKRSTAGLVWFRCGHAAHSYCFRAEHKPAKCDLCARIDGDLRCGDEGECKNVCANWIKTGKCRFGESCLYAMRSDETARGVTARRKQFASPCASFHRAWHGTGIALDLHYEFAPACQF